MVEDLRCCLQQPLGQDRVPRGLGHTRVCDASEIHVAHFFCFYALPWIDVGTEVVAEVTTCPLLHFLVSTVATTMAATVICFSSSFLACSTPSILDLSVGWLVKGPNMIRRG